MSISELLETVRGVATPPFSALFLYGSYARGDAHDSSDIDILQVVANHTAPYSKGKVNVTCYTRGQLIHLAEAGSLFLRHLITEAIPLDDPADFLTTLRSAYIAPKDYHYVFDEVGRAAPIVAIADDAFQENIPHYSATASYLLRSYIYAKAFSLGATSFSMGHVTDVISDGRPRDRLHELHLNRNYPRFQRVVDLLFEFTGTARVYREESLEAFVVNSYGSSELAVILGLRVLARGDLLTYAWGEALE